jgi:hypothetical protein
MLSKLYVLRAAHWNQQFDIGRQVRHLPEQIARVKQDQSGLLEDIQRRDIHGSQDFIMQVGQQTFAGKKSREMAAEALLKALLAEEAAEIRVCGSYKGFQIVMRAGQTYKFYLRGRHTYELFINPQNPLANLSGMESELRRLDRYAEGGREDCERKEKALADYTEQLSRPFEQEGRLRELLVKQAEINRSLDLDKSDTQIVEEAKVA